MARSEMKLRLLIADDSKAFRKQLRAFLKGVEWIDVVAEAEDGVQAVKLAEKHKPDVVLMDQNMPGVSGIEATELIISAHPDIHVLFVVGEESWRQQALEVGAEAFFVKDTGIHAMLQQLHRIHDHKTKGIKSVAQILQDEQLLQNPRPSNDTPEEPGGHPVSQGESAMSINKEPGRMLITGGCGFIGSNLAAHFLDKGWEVVVYDNFTRPSAAVNAAWLEGRGNGRLSILRADVRDYVPLFKSMKGTSVVIHLAAQVAVTSSVGNPLYDFNVNAVGGMHVLEAARVTDPSPIVLYASTNKVYGQLNKLRRTNGNLRYYVPDYPLGIPEEFPIDLHSPYGCSKGVCDLYAIDYARIFGLKTVVFRQSCVYGPRQFGIEDQGWISHFVISAVLGRPITIYGDGRQVRDLLHVDDLVVAYERAIERIDVCSGRAYNIGGGPQNTSSLLELIYRLEVKLDRAIPLVFGNWRPGDQRVYVSDIGSAKQDLDWEPTMSVEEGLDDLCQWVEANKDMIKSISVEGNTPEIPVDDDSVASETASTIDVIKE